MISNEFLQPMGIGELLDKTITLFRRFFLKFLAIAAIGYVPFFILGIIGAVLVVYSTSPYSGFNPGSVENIPPSLIGIWLLLIFIGGILGAVMRISLIKACQQGLFEGQIAIGKCFQVGFKKFFPYLIAAILLWLSLTFGVILLLIPGIIFGVWFSLFEPVTVIENSGYAAALGRSRSLVKGYFWRTLGFFLVSGLLSFAVIGILSQTLALIPFVGQILNLVLQLVIMPFQVIAETLYYYNQRSLKEGFDLSITADQVLTLEGEA